MGWFISEDRVPVELEECRCPNTPHDHDTVWLRAQLGPEGGYAVLRAMRLAEAGQIVSEEELGRAYARFGIVDWTFVDDNGLPVPCNDDNIRRLTWEVIYPVAQKGDDLYSEELIRPLVQRASKSFQRGQTGQRTSPSKRSTSTRRKRSRPSTTAITPIRPRLSQSSDGDSSTSPRKRSASA